MIDIITGFALGYGVPMFLWKRYFVRRRTDSTAQPWTVVDRAA